MHARGTVIAAAFLIAGPVQAQLAEAPQPLLEGEAEAPGSFGPLAAGFKRHSPLYGGNEAANRNARLFPGFRTDPRLVLGYALNPYLAVETGYSFLWDEGFHKVDTFGRRAGAVQSALAASDLSAISHTTYLAAKITVPVNERLSAYGKFGVAHSSVVNDGLVTAQGAQASGKPAGPQTSTGAYGAVGARYKLNDKATLSGEYRVNGSADKFGGASNASGLKGSVGIGF